MLSFKEKELINDFLTKNESFKLTDVCDYLIKKGSTQNTYSSGRYKIYPLIGVYLKAFVLNSLLKMSHTENNVEYTKIGDISIDSKIKIMDIETDKKATTEEGQLSLF